MISCETLFRLYHIKKDVRQMADIFFE